MVRVQKQMPGNFEVSKNFLGKLSVTMGISVILNVGTYIMFNLC